jgi:hypothetical protein
MGELGLMALKASACKNWYFINKRNVQSEVKCITQQFTRIFVFIVVRTLHISLKMPASSGSTRQYLLSERNILHNEELNDLYSSPNIIRVIKSRRMRWAGHVAVWGKREVHIGYWWGDLREGDHLGDTGTDGRILKLILKKGDGGMDWIKLAQDRDKWWALVNVVMNHQVP